MNKSVTLSHEQSCVHDKRLKKNMQKCFIDFYLLIEEV